ncbi:MAG: hypothetical protein JXA94_07095 [Parachlamydiales bacterium]|nr:hypothetical protein [Parachlamydiales bacterium]
MKKNIALTISIFLVFLATYFYSLSKNKDDTVYVYTGFFKNLVTENDQSFFELKKFLNNKRIKIKETRSLKNLKNLKKVIVFDVPKNRMHRIQRIPKKKLVLFTWEPPCVKPENFEKKYLKSFSKVFTFNDDIIDNKTYFKFYYPDAKQMVEKIPSFNEKKLLCLIASNKSSDYKDEIYSKRVEAIKFFEEFAANDFDLLGRGWSKEKFPSYKGAIASDAKIENLKNYKFSLAYENSTDINGYITEKIFDCFTSGCVPIYLGAKNITDYIPENCFIDRRNFKSLSELYVFLKTMTDDDYSKYISNIKKYLTSDESKLFSLNNLQKTLKEAMDINNE